MIVLETIAAFILARPVLWTTLGICAGFAGAAALEALERRRGWVITLWAAAAVSFYGAAAAVAAH